MTNTIADKKITIKQDLVSVIMPFFNSQLTLKRAIELVLMQSYKKLELLIVNDGSTDNSGKICEKAAKKDIRVRLFQTPHVGTSSARNIALDAALGEYVIFCDSDDWMPRRAIEKMVESAKENNSDFVCGGLRFQSLFHSKSFSPEVAGTSHERDSVFRTKIIFSMLQGGAAKLFKRELIESNHIRFVPEIKYAEDSDFANRYLAVCNSLTSIQDIVYIYNRISGTSTCNQYMRHINSYCKHAVETRKLALGKTEYSEFDLQKINSDALGRLTYSVKDYIAKIPNRKALCLTLLKETWEMFKPMINPNLFTQKDYENEITMRTYLMLSNENYEGLYEYIVKKKNLRTDRPQNSHSVSFIKYLAQKLHFRFAPLFIKS